MSAEAEHWKVLASQTDRGVSTVSDLVDAIRDRDPWRADALCREYPNLEWVPDPDTPIVDQVAVCSRCTVRDECFDYAMTTRSLVGIFGGARFPQARRKALRAA